MYWNVRELSSSKLDTRNEKFNDMSGINVPSRRCKRDNDTSLHETIQEDFKTIEKSIKQFHAHIAIGPLYVCTCCHQTWFRKSVSMLKNTPIPAQSRRLLHKFYICQ